MSSLQIPEHKLEPVQVGETLHCFFELALFKEQYEIIANKSKRIQLMAHRRFGKSYAVLKKLVLSAITAKKKNPIFAYIAPDYKQAVNIGWQYMKDFTQHIPGVVISETNHTIKFNFNDGYGVRTVYIGGTGIDGSADSTRGMYLDGVILDEMKDMGENVWHSVIQPMLLDRDGWAVLTGTSGLGYWNDFWMETSQQIKDGTSQFIQLNYTVYDTMRLGTRTGLDIEAEIENLRLTIPRDKFEQEYLNNPNTPSKGSFYGAIIYDLLDRGDLGPDVAKYDPSKKVLVSFDLGFTDETVAIFYQVHGTRYHIIDYKYWTKTLDEVFLKEILDTPYNISHFLFPHDAVNTKIDSRGGSTYDYAKTIAPYVKILIAPNPTHAGKEVAQSKTREILNRCVINSTKCERLVHALNLFGSVWDAKRGTSKVTAERTWALHSADSLQTFALSIDQVNTAYLDSRYTPKIEDYVQQLEDYDIF